jgi:hypothetical protein
MYSQPKIDIREVVNLLGLKVDPKCSINSDTFNVQCPFCRDKKYHMNINTEKNVYSCVLCSKEKGQGALDLYSRVVHGERCIKGQNSKKIFMELCDALHLGEPSERKTEVKERPSPPRILRADDDTVGKTYAALLAFEPFALTEQHRENLKRRGFSDETIDRNEYRSLGQSYDWLSEYPDSRSLYRRLRPTIKENKKLRHKREEEIVAGLALAQHLLKLGCTLTGIPGFYKIGDYWSFNITPGMLVPTRNMNGQVVALQVRRDKPEDWETKNKDRKFLRYMTVSSKGLPDGVTEGISRAHFPLANPPLSKDVHVCVTEGPLKADAASELLGTDAKVFFIALHGTMNTKELPDFFKLCKKKGVERIENAFDMDKTTNCHVAEAGKGVWKKAKAAGLSVAVRCWDKDYAKKKYRELGILCANHDIFVPTSLNVFVDVAAMARALEAAGVEHSVETLPDGTEVKHYWDDATKGIDDYLLTQKQQKKTNS